MATLLLSTAALRAEELPLWEAGIGVASLTLPDYRGSDESRHYALPLPYFVYRGEVFKADRDGVRGVLFAGSRWEVSLSAGASPPVRSDKNSARQGMPDLRSVGELGPSLETTLWEGDDFRLKLRAPLRAAFTLQADVKSVGWVFSPRLNLDIDHLAGTPWRFGALVGPIYATRSHHDYFYSVDSQFANAERPEFAAAGGYGGTQLLFSLSRRFKRTWVAAFVRADSLSSAAFEGSPLVRRSHYVAAGLGLAWILGESSQRVDAVP